MALIDWFGFKVYTNLINKKPYIGISQNVYGRCKYHGDNSPRKFKNALVKYITSTTNRNLQ